MDCYVIIVCAEHRLTHARMELSPKAMDRDENYILLFSHFLLG